VAFIVLAGTAAIAWTIYSVAAKRAASSVGVPGPQWVSVAPLPGSPGEMCQRLSVSATQTGPQDDQSATATAAADMPTAVAIDREPTRVIHDQYPGYANVAVDDNSEEVYLQDENLFGIRVFNRLDNTPPKAVFTEPKRSLEGLNTKLEYDCGLYIDPRNGDLYSLASDTVDAMVVFPRGAQGNAKPMRELTTPRATFSMVVDEESQEILMTVEPNNSVIVYRKMAEGREPPVRTLKGDSTQMADPHGIAVDSKTNLLFVGNKGLIHSEDPHGRSILGSGRYIAPSITVYPLKASGDTAPLRVIQGPKTQLDWAAGMYADPERAEFYVANDGDDSVLVFHETDEGDVAPKRVIKGSKTGLKNPSAVFVDNKNHELWVSNMGNHSASVYSLTANGNVAPLRTIRSAPVGQPTAELGNPGALGYDTKRDQILVPN